MRYVSRFFGFLLLLVLFTIATWGYAFFGKKRAGIEEKQQVARSFLLTDFCLTTESRHTRNIALPELIAPFQDLPGYHDHFPSSSFYQPDFYLRKYK
ncbi:hypothetical protein R9C00_00480 [Flammeovirgaceae bacterium SG7u.111]|nr:hypothetical protein [Flammeovirgaceae bacterium SG7u.132]WPO35925.1 hypothetical protein R9C00_00480 [Flammeovirgaceae bacterium SG7u.111]